MGVQPLCCGHVEPGDGTCSSMGRSSLLDGLRCIAHAKPLHLGHAAVASSANYALHQSHICCRQHIAVSKVLGQGSAIDAVHQVIRMMSHHSFVIVTSNDVTCAEVVAEVAADWVSRLLGDACVIHLASCINTAESKAVHLW